MDAWGWGPNSTVAVVAVVTLAITLFTIVKRWQRGKRPEVTGFLRGITASTRNPYSVLSIPTVVHNPSRHTVQILRIALEQPEEAAFDRGTEGIRELDLDEPVAAEKEVSRAYGIRVPKDWKGNTIVLRFDIAVPAGGRVVQARLRVQIPHS